MHGFTLADEILRNVLEEAGKQNAGGFKASRVAEIHIELGGLLFPGDDENEEIKSAFNLLAKDTIAKDAELKIKTIEGRDCILKKIILE